MMNHAKLFPVAIALSALSSAALTSDELTIIFVELCMVRYPPYPTYLPVLLSKSRIGGLGSMYIPIVTPKTPKVVSSNVSVPFHISVPYSSVVHQRKFNCVEGIPDETGRALSGVTIVGPIVQFPFAKTEIGASTIIVNGALSTIASPLSVTFMVTGSMGVVGTDGGSVNCIDEEYSTSGMSGGLLQPTRTKNEETPEMRSGFVPAHTTKEPIDASQKIMASAKNRLLLTVLNPSYCFVLKYSPSTALTASGTVSNFRALRSASSALSMSSDTDIIIFFIAIFKVQ